MRKKLALFLATAFVLSALTSCQNQDAGKTDDGAAASATEAKSAETEQTAQPGEPEGEELVFGTATLTYEEFYAGDVSSTDSYDGVSSATVSKYEIMPNMATDFVDEETNAEGYHITGVRNVNVAVAEKDCEAFQELNPTFVLNEGDAPAQYKTVTIEDGKAVYGQTAFRIDDTVTDATAELVTGSTWGDYQINVTDGAVKHLRDSREDEFDINSQIQGVILETEKGLKVGLEHLQSIWVQPYEVSWNVPEDNTHNAHIAEFDNLGELARLTGETVTRIIYIMPDCAYIYEFDGIYIKPIYTDSVTASVSDAYDAVTLSTSDFSDFENGTLTVTYALGSGRNREITPLLETALETGTDTYSLDIAALSGLEAGGVYGAVISSDSYADVTVALPMSADQREALETILSTAKEKLEADPDNKTLEEQIGEAEELLSEENPSSAEAGSLISELTELTAEKQEGQGGQEGQEGQEGQDGQRSQEGQGGKEGQESQDGQEGR